MADFRPWPKTRKFSDVVSAILKSMSTGHVAAGTTFEVFGKPKLHGTNAAIVISPDGTVEAQSRNRKITPTSDNAGFAAWVYANQLEWQDYYSPTDTVYLYGEWAGRGIQAGGEAILQLEKAFYPFALVVVNEAGEENLLVEPVEILDFFPNLEEVFDGSVRVVPFVGYAGVYDPSGSNAELVHGINTVTDLVETVDPYVQSIAPGTEGFGEGYVWFLRTLHRSGAVGPWWPGLFKTKTAAHTSGGGGGAKRTPVALDTETFNNIRAFVARHVTPARCVQILKEVVGPQPDAQPAMRDIGPFIKALVADVASETELEVAKSGLPWKKVQKALGATAADWIKTEINRAGGV